MNTNPLESVTPDEVLALARRIAFDSLRLIDLSPDQLEHIAQVVVMANLRDDLKRLADLARIDYEKEIENLPFERQPHGKLGHHHPPTLTESAGSRNGLTEEVWLFWN